MPTDSPSADDTLPATSLHVMGAGLWQLPGSVMQEMLGARGWFRKVHDETGVRMAFLCAHGWMLQWYEGDRAAVEKAWQLAQRHKAQRNLRLLHRSVGASFLPEAVHIASVHDGASPAEVGRRIYRVEREHALGWLAEPADIWQALGAPCRLQEAGGMRSVARRGLVVLTSGYNESIDVLKAVAERIGARPVYQRFATGEQRSSDVGAAYADFDCGNHVTRVQALSRAALANRMVRLGLTGAHCIVLLADERVHAAAALAEEVATWIAGEPMRPEIRIVGPSRESCIAAAGVLAMRAPHLPVGIMSGGVPGRSRADAMLEVLAGVPGSMPAPLDVELS